MDSSLPIVTASTPTEDGRGRLFLMEPGKRIVLEMYDQWHWNAVEDWHAQIKRVSHSPKELGRREQAAIRLRARLLSVPFYAEKDRKSGMDYWRALHSAGVLKD